ncbi:MAG: insulinase family protein [Bacteroidia bacterium]|nr:insulinase family protein [Bacteroidia bacterium]
MREFEIFELNNGLRVIFKPSSGEAAHCGIIINTGTRDEQENEQGLAHFIEHTLFKGTTKRKFYHILGRIDSVGGELNAYTAKEETCIYSSFQKQYLERAVELIADITFNSTFPEKEIDKEKDVIIDEINAYKDTPAEQIYDDFESYIFCNHPLGNNILGTINSVKNIRQKHIVSFIKKHYLINNMVFSVVGDFNLVRLKYILEKHLGHYKTKGYKKLRTAPKANKVFHKKNTINTHQAHCIIGGLAPAVSSKKRNTMTLLNNLLGGPGLNSRLNLNIREKYGFTYNIDSSYITYSDTGLTAIYIGTDKNYLNKTIDLVYKELKKLCAQPLSTMQIHKAKQQLCGNIALAQENNSNVMIALGKSLLLFNKVDTLQTIYNRISDISAKELYQVANEVYNEKKLSTLIFE